VAQLPIPIVYTDAKGTTRTETVITASMQIIREDELEAAGYTVIRD
jgi:hypothetical protein